MNISVVQFYRYPLLRNVRQGSIIDLDIDMFLKISNYEDTVKKLDIYYGIGMGQLRFLLY